MRFKVALRPVPLRCIKESLDGVDDMLLVDRDGPSDVLSVKRDTCVWCVPLSPLPCNVSVALPLGHVPSVLGVDCSKTAS